MTGDGLSDKLITLALGGIGGAFGAFVALKIKLNDMKRDNEDTKRDIGDERAARERLESDLVGRMESVARKQTQTLRVVANIARKVGVDGREFDDALIRMLADEAD